MEELEDFRARLDRELEKIRIAAFVYEVDVARTPRRSGDPDLRRCLLPTGGFAQKDAFAQKVTPLHKNSLKKRLTLFDGLSLLKYVENASNIIAH
jgi:hypothetical protein